MRLTKKIALLVTVPLVAMAAFAGLAIAVAVSDGQRAQRLSDVVSLGRQGAGLAAALQAERAAAVSLLVGPGPVLTDRTTTYLSTVGDTDAEVAALRAARSTARVPAAADQALDRLSTQLDLLTALRVQAQGRTVAASAVAFQYRIIIASTLDYREVMAQAGQAPAEVAAQISLSVDLSRAAEALGLQQVAVLRALDSGRLTPAAATEITASSTAFTDAVESFTAGADPQWRAWWGRATTGADVLAAQQMQDLVARAGTGQALQLDAGAWVAGMQRRIDLVHEVEGLTDAAVLSSAGALGHDAVVQAAWVSAGVLGAALVAVYLAMRLGRPVVADLRRLRDGARAVAYEQLPQLVARLNQAGAWRDTRAEEVVAAAPRTGVAGRHEVGEVAAALDEVFGAAVRSAAELAQARHSVARMLVTLARRVQTRTSQLTQQLDLAEQGERDAERLAWLFRFDHTVTLTRRTADALLVLGGQGSGTVREHAAAVVDVIRAASSRIQDYERVRVGLVDPGLAVPGYLADELALLLAELMDNATAMSRDPVTVNARRLADRMVVQVVDSGIGIPDERRRELNDRLANPVVDTQALAQMGLTVVGMVAAHHGLRVRLRAASRGVIAEVTVPLGLLTAEPAMAQAEGARHRSPAAPRPRPAGDERAGRDRPGDGSEDTRELPIYAAVAAGQGGATLNGLPTRPRPDPGLARAAPPPPMVMTRDPARVAATMAAYARGVSQSRASHPRPPR